MDYLYTKYIQSMYNVGTCYAYLHGKLHKKYNSCICADILYIYKHISRWMLAHIIPDANKTNSLEKFWDVSYGIYNLNVY